jgi:hypothetical protein
MSGSDSSCHWLQGAVRSGLVSLWAGVLLGLLAAGALFGCSPVQSETASADGIAFQGRIVNLEFEGGFFGIVTLQGERLNPHRLPQECQQDGLRVTGRYRERPDRLTVQMWGRPVEILSIEPLGQER